MKKSSLILISAVMLLAVIVGIVGMTAAWFGDIKSANNTVTISSEQPSGNATIVAGSESSSTDDTSSKLHPAIINPGVLLADHTGSLAKIPVIGPDAEAIVGENGTLKSVANQVDISFDFQYSGAPQDGLTSEVAITLESVTLENPRSTDENGNVTVNDSLTDYKEQFVVAMTSYTRDQDAFNLTQNSGDNAYTSKEKTIKVKNDDGTFETIEKATVYVPNENNKDVSTTLKANIFSGSEHTIVITVYFKNVDEETPPELMDVNLFFNFEISLVQQTEAE